MQRVCEEKQQQIEQLQADICGLEGDVEKATGTATEQAELICKLQDEQMVRLVILFAHAASVTACRVQPLAGFDN